MSAANTQHRVGFLLGNNFLALLTEFRGPTAAQHSLLPAQLRAAMLENGGRIGVARASLVATACASPGST